MSSGRRLFPKRFGQVLLRSRKIAEFEVKSLNLSPGDRVLEIGPGEGVLTSIILTHDVTLECVEPDGRFANMLEARFREHVCSGKLHIIKKDFRDLKPERYDRIIGNIPYHISSEIVFGLGEYDFERAILMVQKDFADRMVAGPGDKEYSRLSVNCSYHFQVTRLLDVDRKNFTPVPGVDSTVVRIVPRTSKPEVNKDLLDRALVLLFSQRRKKVGSVVKNCPEGLKDLRPEELSLNDFISLAKCLTPA